MHFPVFIFRPAPRTWRRTAMGLMEVYLGRQTWEDFIGGHGALTDLMGDKSGAFSVGLTARDHLVATKSGLGALNPERLRRESENTVRLALGIEKLAGGLESLKADFNLLLGDHIWRSEMRQESLTNILEEIRLAEFEREAR